MGVEQMQLELARSILFAKNMAEMVGFYRDLLDLVEVNVEAPLVRCDFLDPEGNIFQISSE